MQRPYFLILLCFGPYLCNAQQSSLAYTKLADSLFRYHHYADAANYYTRAIKNAPEPNTLMLNIARSYERMHNTDLAVDWYQKARANNTPFTFIDLYDYAQLLLAQNKLDEAYELMSEMPGVDNNQNLSRRLVDDIRNYKRYFDDSASYKIKPISVNSEVSDFAPTFYKDGIVFSSAKQEDFSKKKFHWDKSYFLNLYYTKKMDDGTFEKAELLDKKLDSRFHDGPVTFYDNGQRMIVNRNKQVKIEGKSKTWMWHLGLYDGYWSAEKKEWVLAALPFDATSYSFAHPSISEDGNVLYFVSDMPGGYGGMDIYRVTRSGGDRWSKPFNLGPSINTTENEVFPFFSNNTLYFSSNGHGGVGGLDIFKSEKTVNGFSAPVNLGYPINSNLDDLSFIISADGKTGYFSSSRNGNDDIFGFVYGQNISLMAHIYNGNTNEPLAGATIELMTSSGNDATLTSDANGDFRFSLPKSDAFVIIGNKDGITGMLSSVVKAEEDAEHYIHPVPAFGDPEKTACIGLIKDESGIAKKATAITITDESTGKLLENQEGHSMVSFLGEKGHRYKVIIENEKGDTTIHYVNVEPNDSGTKTWDMLIKPSQKLQEMAARIFNSADNSPLAGAGAKIVTFLEADIELTANDEGIIEFNLPEGTAYMIVGTKGELSGMHSGVVGMGTDKNSIVHPVPAHGLNSNSLPMMALIANEDGEVLDGLTAIVINKATGESEEVEIVNGVLSYEAEKGSNYTIEVKHEGYIATSNEVKISQSATDTQRLAIVLVEEEPITLLMAARAFKADDKSPLAGADVSIISVVEPDQKLTANEKGEVEFTLPEGTAYVVIANKNGYSGMHAGEAQVGTDKTSVIHPIPASPSDENKIPMVVRFEDRDGKQITGAEIIVKDKSTGKTIPAHITESGLITFVGEKGSEYVIEATYKNHPTVTKSVTVPAGLSENVGKTTIRAPFSISENRPDILLTAHTINDEDNSPLAHANVKIISDGLADQVATTDENGDVTFSLPEGTPFTIVVDKEGYSGMYSDNATNSSDNSNEPLNVTAHKLQTNEVPVVLRIEDESGNGLQNGTVVVTDKKTGKEVEASLSDQGIVNFYGEKNKEYNVAVSRDGNQPLTTATVKPTGTGLTKNILIPTTSIASTNKLSTGIGNTTRPASRESSVEVNLVDENGDEITNGTITVTDRSTGKTITLENQKDGTSTFHGEVGKDYIITVKQDGKFVMEKEISPASSSVKEKILVPDLSPKIQSYQMAARAFRVNDDSPLSDADITIISIVDPDQKRITNSDGLVDFTLPNETAFVIIANKAGYMGMYSGVAEKGTDKTSIVFPIPTHTDAVNQVSMVAFVRDSQGTIIKEGIAKVTDKTTGQTTEVKIKNGVFSLMAQKGNDYALSVSSDGYDNWEKEIHVSTNDNISSMVDVRLKATAFTLPVSSEVIVVKNDSQTSKLYIVTDGKANEIIERDGMIYLHTNSEDKLLGNGSLKSFANQNSLIGEKLSVSNENITSIQNIYFDYNDYSLDSFDKLELDKVHDLLTKYPSMTITVNAHADMRGSESYNYNLTKKRSNSVQSYLVENGITQNRVAKKSFGKSIPAVACNTPGCTEEQHQLNRRAEFSFLTSEETTSATITSTANNEKSKISFQEYLTKYGDATLPGLAFKVTIGAYRYNHDLTFDELSDLGTVESKNANGITYYYLSSYNSLKEVNDTRLMVIERGVKDASIRITYNDKTISFPEFISMVE